MQNYYELYFCSKYILENIFKALNKCPLILNHKQWNYTLKNYSITYVKLQIQSCHCHQMKELVSFLLILQKKQLKTNLRSKIIDLPPDSCWVKLFSSSTLIWKRHASRHIGIILARLFKGYVFTIVIFKSDDSTNFKLVMVWTQFLRLGVQDFWRYIAELSFWRIQS